MTKCLLFEVRRDKMAVIDATSIQRQYNFEYSGRVMLTEGEDQIVIKIPTIPDGVKAVFGIQITGTPVSVTEDTIEVEVKPTDTLIVRERTV